jgi:NADH-quinone oxidoreductase subunit H
MINIAFKILDIICVILPLILSVAYLTYAERKVIAAAQLRQGPSKVGIYGILQPIADAVKLILKEMIIPDKAHKKLFILAPAITFILAFIGWAVIPFDAKVLSDGTYIPSVIADINVGILYLLAISSLGVYGIIIAGWSSNSSYAFLGALRSASQMISYELSMGVVIATVALLTKSLNLTEMVIAKHNLSIWWDIAMFPMAIVFFICILAETNRHPFDLPEAEAELVSGYNVEYSSIAFALFFLGEYANMILTSAVICILFLGGWYPPLDFQFLYYIPGIFWLMLKIIFVLFWFIILRATLPRYRYDQLMNLGWKVLLPLSFVWFILISSAVFVLQM